MNDSFIFHPPTRAGLIFHLVSIVVFITAGTIGLYRIAYAVVGPAFLLYLLLIILAIPSVPYLIYRLSVLQNSTYILERESIHLKWGLRVEVIPINTILWVQRASEITEPIRYPWIRWPGSVTGMRRLSGGTSLEFMATKTSDLVLVATYERTFAISPTDPSEFLRTYQKLTELGSLIPPQPQSVHPTFILARIWRTPPARYLVAASFLLSLALVTWVSLVAPTLTEVSLGFLASGDPREAIPGIRLMLLPVLNTIFWVFNFFAGLFLFRRDNQRPLGYLLWGNSILIAGLFLLAVYVILRID